MEPDWSLIMTGLVANNLPKYFPKCFSSVDCQNYYFSSPKPNWGSKSNVKYVECCTFGFLQKEFPKSMRKSRK